MVERCEAREQHDVRDGSAGYSVEVEIMASQEVPPGYKRTEAGVIPEDWSTETIFAIAGYSKNRFDDGDWVEAEFLTTSGVRLLQTGNIGVGMFREKEPQKYISPQSFQQLRCKDVLPGDLLVCRLADPAGRACIAPDLGSQRMITSVDVTIFRPTPELGDPTFLLGVFCTPGWFSEVSDRCGGSTRTRISRSQLAKIPIQLPSIHEQRAIATALSDADALIESLDRLIAKKRAIKQAVMQQLLTGQTRLPGFTGEWETEVFGDVLERKNLKSYQIQTTDYRPSGKYPVVDQGKESVVGFTDRDDKVFSCPQTGVIVFGDHTCIVKFVDFDFAVGADGTQVLQARNGHCTRFYGYQLEYNGVQPTGYNRHYKFLKEKYFPVPESEEQTAIAAVLSNMDTDIEVLERRRAKARRIKRGMMQELLTGRVRLVKPSLKGASQ